ncbi:MAG: hypothetical protein ASUL_09574 [Candidatus Aramenus sulfurataquae]|uniref:Uncharacterized protein n=1 Tax=Candidatus Aramenus sulfurataquae TaxID=1326980 RepID=W7KJN1_9CREN|nr:MAG: hypothetical protein ASUL_09574 [Candidatus Aramenus sulfurataquae]
MNTQPNSPNSTSSGVGDFSNTLTPEERVLEILDKYEPAEPWEGFRYLGRGLLTLRTTPENLEHIVMQGNYAVEYLGEYYMDYGIYNVHSSTFNEDRKECEEEGYFYFNGECHTLRYDDILVIYYDRWKREEDGVVIKEYYAITQEQAEEGEEE